MAVIQDGEQLFGIETKEITLAGGGQYVVESFSLTSPSNRVDLDNGDGEALGSTIVPQRQEASITIQVGDQTTSPVIGDTASYAGKTIVISGIDRTENQADYRRFTLSGYVKINV